MKTTKLISLTTLASAALLAIAPAIGVHAATGYDTSKPEGANGLPTYSDAKLPAVQGSKENAVADPAKGMGANDKANSTTGTPATATSEAWAQVTSGYLTLDAVPDLHFGTVVSGMNAGLYDNQSIRDNDGNQQGLLQVTDARTATTGEAPNTTTQQGLGYDLTASMGAFNGYNTEGAATNDAGGNNPEITPTKGWTLKLSNNGGLVDTANGAVANADNALKAPTLTDDGASQEVIQTKPGTAFGTVRHSYLKNTDATLSVPAGVTKGYYVANLTWTLNAKGTAAVN